jgi:perosamine synthetase
VDERAEHGLFKYPVMLSETWPIDVGTAASLLAGEGVPVTPAHPYLLDIQWLRECQHPAFRHTGLADSEYDPGSCPSAAQLVRRQLCIDVGPGLEEQDMAAIVAAFERCDRLVRG